MALTEKQEQDLLAGVANLTKGLETITTENATLKAQLAEKDTKITDLATKVSAASQEVAFNALKTKYPDVPENILKSVPEAEAKALQDKFSSLKAGSQPPKTDLLNEWANAGGIGPTTEAEVQAREAKDRERLAEATSKGDLQGVIEASNVKIADFLRKSPAFNGRA